MIKKTLNFSNPAYLSVSNRQLIVDVPKSDLSEARKATIPIEDIGVLILEHPQITITHNVLAALLENNVAIVTSGQSRLPSGLLLPLDGHTNQSERFKFQIEASLPLKKNLWQQTIQVKIANQAALLAAKGLNVENMKYWINAVKSGDSENHEARAAAYYWSKIFPDELNFLRGRHEAPPNNLLNYGYAVLRAMVARALVGSGLLPTLGIHHRNKYNAYCLADDIMEPYRPYVDQIVLQLVHSGNPYEELTREHKAELMKIAQVDVFLDGQHSPLMIALQRTTASLSRCFEGVQRKISYPELCISKVE